MNQLYHRAERHRDEKRGLGHHVHSALKTTLVFSKKVAIHKRIAVMVSTEDVPGRFLPRTFSPSVPP